jgi:hypothetical protein
MHSRRGKQGSQKVPEEGPDSVSLCQANEVEETEWRLDQFTSQNPTKKLNKNQRKGRAKREGEIGAPPFSSSSGTPGTSRSSRGLTSHAES